MKLFIAVLAVVTSLLSSCATKPDQFDVSLDAAALQLMKLNPTPGQQ